MKIKNKRVVRYTGQVIDLTVQNTHTYNVHGLAVHNSGGGSLVNYVLGITGLDPLKHDLLFSRFISPSRCLDPKTYVRVSETESKQISDLKINDTVMTETGTATVVATQETDHDLRYTLTVAGNKIKCSSDHRWIAMRNGSRVELRTHELTTDDELIIDDEISLTRKI